jgi:2'-5' RNA ligase
MAADGDNLRRMKRTFIGVRISDEARAAAAARISLLRGEFPELRVGWERPEKLHLTLKFLGDTDEKSVPAISEILRQIAEERAPFRLGIGSGGAFPDGKRPRILWLGIDDDDGRLSALRESVEDRLAEIGFARDRRRFAPHLTIARIREPESAARLARRHWTEPAAGVSSPVSAITFYQSTLRPGGSVYSVLGEFRLTGRN